MKTLWKNGNFYLNHGFVKGDMVTEDGIILKIGKSAVNEEAMDSAACNAEAGNAEAGNAEAGNAGTGNAEAGTAAVKGSDRIVYDLEGRTVVPGFIDIHTHGAAGIDVNGADGEGFERICRFFASRGTTGWLCSILTDSKDQTLEAIRQYQAWKRLPHKGAELLGIHLEGPFLSPEYKGAMPEQLLRKADMALLKEYQEAAGGEIRYLTVAPEVEGVLESIPAMKALGMEVAIGHSGADYETARAAIRNGAVGATHTGNGMKLLHQHEPAVWGAVLEADDVFCEMICDGRHLHPGTVRFLVKMKGPDRVVAVTDSIMAAGLPDGRYRLGVNSVVVADGDAMLADGKSRAGSTLTMGQALQNVLKFTGYSLQEVIPMFTENPARLIGIYDQVGSLNPGKAANLVVLDEEYQVIRTYVRGRECYRKAEEKNNPSAD